MAIPFSNTTQRIPPGFANLLEGLAREVLRSQPEDIPSFAAKYFETLLIEREKTGYDPSVWGAKLDDRYYNNRAFNELAPPSGSSKPEEKGGERAAQSEEAAKKLETQASDTGLKASDSGLTEEQAAVKIQASFRGFKTRQELKTSKEEVTEGQEEEKEEEKVIGKEPGEETGKEEETSKPDTNEPQ